MTHNYTITGMTCAGCQAKVKKLLSQVDGVKNIEVTLEKAEAAIEMDRHLSADLFTAALKDYPKYQISEASHAAAPDNAPAAGAGSWLTTYKPILLIFGYITLVSIIAASLANGFNGALAMRVFMSGFFLTFSFFKMLDLQGFADSYAMYDIVARRFRSWGYAYASLELALGIAFAINFQPLLTNGITFLVMTVSIIGVLQSVLTKRKIQCACLGAVFNLPMSTVTIIEDGLMIAMSGILLLSFR
jgi:copper chaperone CopZ